MVQRKFNQWRCFTMLVFSGPSSINPDTGKPYGSSFPMLSVEDFVRAQFELIAHLGIEKVGSFMGKILNSTIISLG